MAIFSYKGIDSKGKEVASTITCETEILAKQRLKAQGIKLMSLTEKKVGTSNKGGGSSNSKPFSFLQKKVSVNDLALMTRQFATLVKARIQIVESLSALINQVDNEHLKSVIADVKTRVNEGTSLGKALAQHKDVFDNVYINMVEAGEASGTLDVVLVKLAQFKESQMKLKNKISGAMMYPMLMGTAGSAVLCLIFIFVVPQFANMLKSQKKQLPLVTEYTMAVSTFLQGYWWATIIGIGVALFFFLKYIKTPHGERRWHRFLLTVPIGGNIVKMINVGRFSSTLSTLLTSGVPILSAMTIVKNLVPNVWMQDAIDKSRAAISEGSSLTGPLIESGYFPTMVTHMIKLGESSGELENMLNIISDNYQDEVDNKIAGLTSLLEPIMILIMAVVVFIVVLSVLLPMLEMMNVR